jgi:hypothetical protein
MRSSHDGGCHASCPVCVSAEQGLAALLDPVRIATESVHVGLDREILREAEEAGVLTVPALVIAGEVFHINHGADLTAWL